MTPLNTFDRDWALARVRIHARIDAQCRAALAEVKGKQFNRSLGQIQRHKKPTGR